MSKHAFQDVFELYWVPNPHVCIDDFTLIFHEVISLFLFPMQPFPTEDVEERWVHWGIDFKLAFKVVLKWDTFWLLHSSINAGIHWLLLGNDCWHCVHMWGISVVIYLCVHCSSGMKRLPFSDEEFGSPPNKMARGGEPKKGTTCVFTCLC